MTSGGTFSNNIKTSSGSQIELLQVTRPARKAEFVEEQERDTPEGIRQVATYLADVRVHAVRDHVVVIDIDRVGTAEEAELVAEAITGTETAYRTAESTVSISGHGYQIGLPVATDAGMYIHDTITMDAVSGMIVCTRKAADCCPAGGNSELAEALIKSRKRHLD